MAVDPTPVFWNRILEEVLLRLPTQQSFDTWFQPLRARRATDEVLEIQVPNLFFVEWIQEHYLDLLAECAQRVLGTSPRVQFIVSPELEVLESPSAPETDLAAETSPAPAGSSRGLASSPGRLFEPTRGAEAPATGLRDSGLVSRYSFYTFVVGSLNHMSHASALAVASRPGLHYNPLVIYGGVGLGKTHLMHAIGHAVLEARPDACIYYMSAENFMNQMIASIQNNNSLAFRNKYRRADLLLIDDVQFLAGKDATQEEFFYTFNALYETQKQIVLTTDKPPKDIAGLEERLVSRFNQGLVVDVKPPELETRVAILQKRAAADRFRLPGEIALLIASHVRGNVRELEGCLLRLVALTALTGRRDPTIEMAEEVLGEFVKAESLAIEPERIVNSVAEHYGITREQLRGKRRTNAVALPRQVAMFLMRRTTTLSLAEIGRHFNRDHTTVIHACDKIERLCGSDRGVRASVEALTVALEGES